MQDEWTLAQIPGENPARHYRPAGWGPTLVKALRDCIQEIDRFPETP